MNSHMLLVVAYLCTAHFTNGDHLKKIINRHELGLKDLPGERGRLSDASCSLKYIKHGCYKDKTKPSLRTMRELLLQDRYQGKTFSGKKIDWHNWVTYLPDLVCRCARAASSKGYVFFGIQFFGECWSSADAGDRFHMYGPSDKCINTAFKPCDDQARDETCAGDNFENYVYEIVSESPAGSGVEPPIEPEEY